MTPEREAEIRKTLALCSQELGRCRCWDSSDVVTLLAALDAERAHADKLAAALDDALKWMLVPSDTEPQHYEALGYARNDGREALMEHRARRQTT